MSILGKWHPSARPGIQVIGYEGSPEQVRGFCMCLPSFAALLILATHVKGLHLFLMKFKRPIVSRAELNDTYQRSCELSKLARELVRTSREL